jgi:preprotein translocase subunit SecG
MVYVLTFIHVIVCLFLIIVVLLQSGKAADLAGAFGGLGSQTVFGPRGSATVLTRATTISAILFMITSLSLSIVATESSAPGGDILDKISAPAGAAVKPPSEDQQNQGTSSQPAGPVTPAEPAPQQK